MRGLGNRLEKTFEAIGYRQGFKAGRKAGLLEAEAFIRRNYLRPRKNFSVIFYVEIGNIAEDVRALVDKEEKK